MSTFSELRTHLTETLAEEETATAAYIAMVESGTYTDAQLEVERQKLLKIYNYRVELYNLIQSVIDIHTASNSLADSTFSATSTVNGKLDDLVNQTDFQKLRDSNTKQSIITSNLNYGKQYADYRQLFIILIIICACLIVASLLSYTPLVVLTRPLTSLIYIVGGAYLAYFLINMFMKTYANNDEYDWTLSPNNTSKTSILPTLSGTFGGKIKQTKIQSSSCVGDECCGAGSTWNSATQLCT